MSTPSWTMERRLYATLTGDASLMGLVTGVYVDSVPPQTPFPYIYITGVAFDDIAYVGERTVYSSGVYACRVVGEAGGYGALVTAALDALLSSVNTRDAAVQAMLAELAQEAGLYPPKETVDAEPQVDRAEELRQKWGVESGDLWQLGEHRLICGDCTDSAVVARVMEGGGCPTLVYDPEWDAMPPPAYESALVFGDGQRAADAIRLFGAPAWVFGWDCVSCWYTPNRPLRRMKLCLWYGAMDSYRFDGWHYGDAGDAREVFNTRGSYQFKPDPRGKHLADLFSAPITRLHAESEHNHSKPLDWITLLIANCTQGDVFDPFSGSGTTIIACEQLGRKCRAVEISPGYVAVALERWATATGREPVRLE